MGLTFAKSVKFGAVRFNFSGSGIGMSVGIPGLRIGTGPRGAYIGGGMGGFRYRKSLGRTSATPSPQGRFALPSEGGAASSPNIIATVEHDSKNVLELTDSSSDAILQSMNEQRAKNSFWPPTAILLALLFFLIRGVGSAWPAFVLWLIFFAFAGFVAWVAWRDKLRKLTVLFFEPDEAASATYETVVDSFRTATNVAKLQAIGQTATYGDTKYTAGASRGYKLVKGSFELGQAPGVIANIDVPILKTDKTTLAFYPDRVLAFQDKAVGAIDYRDFDVESSPSKFVEEGPQPSDATVVDETWKYVNKKGGPDKRFKDNKRYPICLYNELHLTTQNGLDIRFIGSKDKAFDSFAGSLGGLKRSL